MIKGGTKDMEVKDFSRDRKSLREKNDGVSSNHQGGIIQIPQKDESLGADIVPSPLLGL